MNLDLLFVHTIYNEPRFLCRASGYAKNYDYFTVVDFDNMTASWGVGLDAPVNTQKIKFNPTEKIWQRTTLDSNEYFMGFTKSGCTFDDRDLNKAYKKYLNAQK